MRDAGGQRGLSLLEIVVVAALMGVLLTLAFSRWQGYQDQQRLRYGVAQVAADLRQAQERAKAERIGYTVTFALGSRAYAITRAGGGFRENAELPTGVTPSANLTVSFTPFGQPAAAQVVTLQNPAGSATVTVSSFGGITYVGP